MKRLCNKKAFTLIEILIAIAIMGVGIVGLVASASRCLGVARKAKNYENARRLLGEVELKFTDYLLEESKKVGELQAESETFHLEAPYNHYTGSWSLTPLDEEDEEREGLFEVHLKISWSDSRKASSEEVVTYLYRPQN